MTPEQADDGLVELHLPDGGQLLVAIGAGPGRGELEASVVQTLLSAGDEVAVIAALTSHAEAVGLSATVVDRPGAIIVDLR